MILVYRVIHTGQVLDRIDLGMNTVEYESQVAKPVVDRFIEKYGYAAAGVILCDWDNGYVRISAE